MKQIRRQRQRAFTLIEIILVVTIITILGAMVVKNLGPRAEDARRKVAKADIDANIAGALDLYQLDNGTFPSTEQGLEALVKKPSSSPEPMNWQGPYLKKKRIPTDPWGNPYQYENPGTNNTDGYDLFSMGKDGATGGDDDIVNWEDENEL